MRACASAGSGGFTRSAGCEPAVYGDPMQLERETSAFGGQARILREWADLHGPSIDLGTARHIAVDELGADRLLSPAELRRLLGWPLPTSQRGSIPRRAGIFGKLRSCPSTIGWRR